MGLRRIIEQEVDKQEWGLELPKYVMMGGTTALRLTDRGTYYRDAGDWDVEYKVEDDKIYSVSSVKSINGKELTTTTKDEWYEQNQDYYKDDSDSEGFTWMTNARNINPNDKVMESEFDWTNDILDTISQEGDIEYFLYRDMNNIDPETNKPVSRDEGVVVDLTYWIEPTNEKPEAYHVCWYEHTTDNIKSKVCTRFRATSIVRMFNDGEFIFI